jgi:predicted O-methyltransferase YrrM
VIARPLRRAKFRFEQFVARRAMNVAGFLFRDVRCLTDLFLPHFAEPAEWISGVSNSVWLLYGSVRALKPQVIVEIGSSRGLSTCAMALACFHNESGRVYAIDPHERNPWTDRGTTGNSLPFLRERLARYRLGEWCEILRDYSHNVAKQWNRPIDFLFIDGDHSYAGVKSDFESFAPWLTPNALVAFHDSGWQDTTRIEGFTQEMGVPKYLEELRSAGYQSVTFPTLPGLTLLQAHPGGYRFLGGGIAEYDRGQWLFRRPNPPFTDSL